MTGKFIVFEGGDGCGKTTQIRRLYDFLMSELFPEHEGIERDEKPILLTKEPGATHLGQQLRRILLNPEESDEGALPIAELLLYAADRAQHVQQILQPRLEQGHWILCDRHVDSTIAYQGFGRGLDRNLIEQLNRIATANLVSNLTLWLDLPVDLARQRLAGRGEADRMEQLDDAFQYRVQQGFEWLAQQYPNRIVRIDASGSEDEVAERIQQTVRDRFLISPETV